MAIRVSTELRSAPTGELISWLSAAAILPIEMAFSASCARSCAPVNASATLTASCVISNSRRRCS